MDFAFKLVFGALFLLVGVWFYLCHRLFKRLEARSPEKFESMGRPSLIMNNSLRTNAAFLKFLFKREWKELDDPGLAALGRFMLVFLIANVAASYGLLYAVLTYGS